jgi:hypothetical protein
MASNVDICNLALSLIGDVAKVSSITPPDGSVQSERCARYYPMALRSMLELHPWNFATRRVALQQIDTAELPEMWAYCYGYPANSVRVLHVLPKGEIDTAYAADYDVTTLTTGVKVIFSNQVIADCMFIAEVTDTSKFSGLFTDALARLLASRLAGPTIKGAAGMRVAADHLNHFTNFDLPAARTADASERRSSQIGKATPSAIGARR